MTVDTREADPNDDGPAVSGQTGERDLMFGMTVGVLMALTAIALAIIFSL